MEEGNFSLRPEKISTSHRNHVDEQGLICLEDSYLSTDLNRHSGLVLALLMESVSFRMSLENPPHIWHSACCNCKIIHEDSHKRLLTLDLLRGPRHSGLTALTRSSPEQIGSLRCSPQ